MGKDKGGLISRQIQLCDLCVVQQVYKDLISYFLPMFRYVYI